MDACENGDVSGGDIVDVRMMGKIDVLVQWFVDIALFKCIPGVKIERVTCTDEIRVIFLQHFAKIEIRRM